MSTDQERRDLALLPPNATALEEAIAASCARLEGVPVPLRPLWSPAQVPAPLLPWLGWALSTDVWDPDWSAVEKRAAVMAAPGIHRVKGTRAAVEAALSLLGWEGSVTEWWEEMPRARRGTFAVLLDALDGRAAGRPALSDRQILRLAAAIERTRPISRGAALRIRLRSAGRIGMAGSAGGRIGARLPVVMAPPPPADERLGLVVAAVARLQDRGLTARLGTTPSPAGRVQASAAGAARITLRLAFGWKSCSRVEEGASQTVPRLANG